MPKREEIFLANLREKLLQKQLIASGSYINHGDEEAIGTNSAPQLNCSIDGFPLEFDFISAYEIQIDILQKPPIYMKIVHRNGLGKLLEKLKKPIKTGDADFDQKYTIKYVTQGKASAFFNAEIREIISNFGKFYHLYTDSRVC